MTDINKYTGEPRYGNQMFPYECLTLEEYQEKGLDHGLQCRDCKLVVDQDATVSPGICLSCYSKEKEKNICVCCNKEKR